MMYFAMGFGIWEMLIILVIVLILFGAGKLPKVMSQLGKGTKAFKDGVKGEAAEQGEPGQIDVTPQAADAAMPDAAMAEAVEVKPADASSD
jgi:sec-independent protein translocase protein TatA